MKIAIDLQGIQSESRFRGIGRYSSELVQALIRLNPDVQFELILNGAFEESLNEIKAEYLNYGVNVSVWVWHPPLPLTGDCLNPGDPARVVAEAAREFFIAELLPDVLLITSLFEGYVDPAVITIKKYRPEITTATIFYDLIPLLNPDIYLDPHPVFRKAYFERIDALKKSDFILAISASAEEEASTHLDLRYPLSINISAGCNDIFRVLNPDADRLRDLHHSLGIVRPFTLYTGGSDGRKNLPRLIKAYASLPDETRQSHQLILVGKMPKENVLALKTIARDAGLNGSDIVWTGYLSDEEMVLLFNSCRCFVLPSLHEGFGLPALEAMKCGALVIGANTSSIPEVIGFKEALFNPLDIDEMAECLNKALMDEAFRARVFAGTARQKDQFSWDASANKAIQIIRHLTSDSVDSPPLQNRSRRMLELMETAPSFGQLASDSICVELSRGLSDLFNQTPRRQLFLDVSELVKTNARTGVQRVVRQFLEGLYRSPLASYSVEPVYATEQHGYRYAHQCLAGINGVSVNGDIEDRDIIFQAGDVFLGLDLQHYVQLKEHSFYEQLRAHQVKVVFVVYDLLPITHPSMFKDPALPDLHARWIRMISNMDGAISTSQTVSEAFKRWLSSEGVALAPDFINGYVHLGADIPLTSISQADLRGSPRLLSLKSGLNFLCVGTLEPRKNQGQVLDAFELLWAAKKPVNLIFVGARGWGVEALIQRLEQNPQNGLRLLWIEGPDDDLLTSIYNSCACLILASLDEGFGLPIIEAAHQQLDLILRDIPVFREVAGKHALYFHGNNPGDLASAVSHWLDLKNAQKQPSSAQIPVLTWDQSTAALKDVLSRLGSPERQFLIDVSALIFHDAGTGIQRVVRQLLNYFVEHPPAGFRVRPIYATQERPYCYGILPSGEFKSGALMQSDEAVEVCPGDIYFGLDMNPDVQPLHADYFTKLRSTGVWVCFMIYDLLCLEMPEFFEPAVVETYRKWLNVASSGDAVICISKTVAEQLCQWVESHQLAVKRSLQIDWAHLAWTPFPHVHSDESVRENSSTRFLNGNQSIVMVGTLEPRKAHGQALEAFEILWRDGISINLVIVGKRGWMNNELLERLDNHPERNQRLFWYEQPDDILLSTIYRHASGLLAASHGEGFGLPLIEAASVGLPVIARDISVFREVAGEHAFYFEGNLAEDLAIAIREWLCLPRIAAALDSAKIPLNTWEDCGKRVATLLMKRPTLTNLQTKTLARDT